MDVEYPMLHWLLWSVHATIWSYACSAIMSSSFSVIKKLCAKENSVRMNSANTFSKWCHYEMHCLGIGLGWTILPRAFGGTNFTTQNKEISITFTNFPHSFLAFLHWLG
jgi:hypothetical protein